MTGWPGWGRPTSCGRPTPEALVERTGAGAPGLWGDDAGREGAGALPLGTGRGLVAGRGLGLVAAAASGLRTWGGSGLLTGGAGGRLGALAGLAGPAAIGVGFGGELGRAGAAAVGA